MNNKKEINRLFDLDFGRHPETVFRFAGVMIGALLLYLYTGWGLALLWGAGFAGAQFVYFRFMTSVSRKDPGAISARDMTVAACLFILVLACVLWMPVYMITSTDKALSIAGGAAIGCILVFLVRRSDSLPLMFIGEIAVVALFILVALLFLLPRFGSMPARVGVLTSGLLLVAYFADTVRVVRRQRLTAEDAAQRNSQIAKMAAVGQLAGGVAHEFNNKLTAIMGSLELMREIDDPAERRANLDTAHLAASEAAQTVRHLMVYARKEPLRAEFLECEALCNDLVARSQGIVTGMIKVETHRDPTLEWLFADRNQILMALTNLVVNAVDAMPEGGTLAIDWSPVTLDRPPPLADGAFLRAGTYVAISVRDTGEGIPSDLMPKVIEPFFSTKPVGKGTGLGLSIVLGVAREHGGGLRLVSDATGTTTTIYLPFVARDGVETGDGQDVR